MDKIKSTEKTVYRIIIICFCLLFIPVFFCVVFLDKIIPYYDSYRLTTLLPNAVLFAVGIVALLIGSFVIYKGRTFSGKRSLTVMNLMLPLIFIVLYFVNVYIARETVYYTGWDPEVVRGYAYLMDGRETLGYDLYLIMYPNNIPISYILGKLYIFANELGAKYPYNSEFLWNQVACVFVSAAGLATCCTVKKIVKNQMTVYLCAVMYIACVGLTPWKNIAYTDIYALAFPVLSICFYVYYRFCGNNIGKSIYLILSFLSGGLGGLIKPNAYIALIAIMIVELGRTVFEKEHRPWRWLLVEAILLLAVIGGARYAQQQMVQQLGLTENKDISATWHHFFYMGLNEETTGGYNSADCGMFGEFQFAPIEVRNKAELERAFDRIRQRGVIGSLYFWLKKMVMTFNDGTFSWQLEGYYKSAFAPIAENGKLTPFLRSIFWANGTYCGQYSTICQFVWITVLSCLPGVCLRRRDREEMNSLLLIHFIGVYLYMLLFEARARYLLCFAPVLIVQAALGLDAYSTCVSKWISDWRMKRHGRSKENAPA